MNAKFQNKKAHRLALCALLLLLGTLLCAILLLYQDSQLYNNIVRLHVIANSDSAQDQALKLEVRDAILSQAESLCAQSDDRDSARNALEAHQAELTSCALAVIEQAGYDYDVTIHFGKEAYPERNYGTLTLPAGVYESVRIVIGEGAGQNWWCVLFPPLCVETAEAKQTLSQSGFTQSQIRILTEADNPQYRIRFRAVESFQNWRNRLRA